MKKKNILILISIFMFAITIGAIILLEVKFMAIFNFYKLIISRFFMLYAIGVAIFIFLDNDDPYRTLSWLMVLLLLPYIGLILYILFGKNLRPKRIAIKKMESNKTFDERVAESQLDMVDYFAMTNADERSINFAKVVKLLLNNSQSLITLNNKVEVLENGKKTFSSIMKDLREAKETIHLEYFIIKDDQLGNEIKDILIDKANNGINVRVIYDAVGSWKLSRKFKEELKNAGVCIYPFYPVVFPVITRELNYRNHRKIIIVDGEIGFLGGLNIGDEYLGRNKFLGFWRDTHLRIIGEGVSSIQKIFINDWKFVSNELLIDDKLFKKSEYVGDCVLQIAASGPDSNWKNIHQGYFTLINIAKEKIWIETPYLIPDDSLKNALKVAALSGIDVRIIIPDIPDHFFVYWASRDNIEGLLEAGVKIYTYKKGFIHAKILLVDGLAASVGTANMDIRSFAINYEVNAFIYGKKTIERLEEDFLVDIEDSKEIDYEKHLERSVLEKTKEALGRLVSTTQ